MTKQYFYTDPLAASWMQNKFGMKLYRITTQDMVDEYGCGEVGEQFDWNDSSIMQEIDTVGDLLPHLYGIDYGPIYIHPDSLPLLEAQMDDWGGDRIISGNVLSITASLVTINTIERHNGKTHYCIPRFEFRTQKRTGIAFIWPESEPSESPQPNPGE